MSESKRAELVAECERLAAEAYAKRQCSVAAWEAGQVELSEAYDRQAEDRESLCYALSQKCGLA